MNLPEGAKAATVAAGCFWGVEHMYRREFGKKGLYDARVGYIGGDTQNPGYRAVCSGRTGRTYTTLAPLCVQRIGSRVKIAFKTTVLTIVKTPRHFR
jgi:hypothetical protein